MARRKSPTPEDYWRAVAKSPLIPNSWMTPEYVELAELKWEVGPFHCGFAEDNGFEGWEEGSRWFLPPLLWNRHPEAFCRNRPTYASFVSEVGNGVRCEPLDRQYFYSAFRFLKMEGKQWAVFRKNARKFPDRTDKPLHYIQLDDDTHTDQIGDLLVKWAEGREVQDNVVMTRFLLLGKLRWGLFVGDRLVGVNVADYNFKHGVYRFCIDDGSPFLQEYLRWRFYTSPWAQEKLIINDGGDLDNPNLAKFKRKLNPINIRTVYTYSLR